MLNNIKYINNYFGEKMNKVLVILIFLSSILYGNENLIEATKSGDLEKVKALIENTSKNNSSEYLDYENNTALIYASLYGYRDIVKFLIDSGVNINARNMYGQTSLIVASSEGHTEIAKLLIKKGALLDVQNMHGITALSYVSGNGDYELLEALLDAGALVNVPSNRGYTELMWASLNGHINVVKFLFGNGASLSINVENFNYKTALDIASDEGHFEVAEYLIFFS